MSSFFQNFKKDDDGNIVECKMHDLVHDFTEFLTKTDCSLLVNNEKICSHKIRHLTVADVENPSIYEAKKLRTLLVGIPPKLVPSALHKLTCLRTLDLSAQTSVLEVLPSEVSRLLHLRYLDLSDTRLKELPKTMRSLVNLQTLKLNRCLNLCKLSEGIVELSNLRHLEVELTYSLKYYPRGGIERLRQLRTLIDFREMELLGYVFSGFSFVHFAIKYEAQLEDGTLVSKSKGVEFTIGDGGSFVPYFRGYFSPKTLESCKDNEEGRKGSPDKGKPQRYGSGVKALMPPTATLLITLELVSWEDRGSRKLGVEV
ncbi:hypothetical protein IFM89_024628 [Coptis chinensis]|uniref:peptidylprolyl isomerase n=1 Tax=Coptis chinensis TaxID=261450 RepID=A0A835I621_9MAGN|nr:hypothetical protein IFM89_024628 [Coptis chinensis]